MSPAALVQGSIYEPDLLCKYFPLFLFSPFFLFDSLLLVLPFSSPPPPLCPTSFQPFTLVRARRSGCGKESRPIFPYHFPAPATPFRSQSPLAFISQLSGIPIAQFPLATPWRHSSACPSKRRHFPRRGWKLRKITYSKYT